MKIFGYGSLLSAQGINEHKLGPQKISEGNLSEAILHGYSRAFNAVSGHWRYLGLTKAPGALTNGVIFDLNPSELSRFEAVEGVGDTYDMVDVSKDIRPTQSEPVFTLITKKPSTNGKVPEDYVESIAEALGKRTFSFQNAFKFGK
jgi:cation transport regulator ChaC